MFQKLENSLHLAKECWRVLMLDKELLMFPVLTFFTTMLTYAGIGYVLWQSGFVDRITQNLNETSQVTIILFGLMFSFVVLFISHFIMTFFNIALVACAIIRFVGGNPTIGDGLGVSARRMHQILGWSVLVSCVGVILQLIRDKRNGMIGRFVAGVLGAGWKIATYFVVPVIVAEEKGPFDAVKSSVNVMKKMWGEAAIINFALSLLGVPVMFLTVAIVALCVRGPFSGTGLEVPLISLAVMFAIIATIALSTMDTIAKAALYYFATENEVPEGFTHETLDRLITQKTT